MTSSEHNHCPICNSKLYKDAETFEILECINKHCRYKPNNNNMLYPYVTVENALIMAYERLKLSI
jgi:hypothetical protein